MTNIKTTDLKSSGKTSKLLRMTIGCLVTTLLALAIIAMLTKKEAITHISGGVVEEISHSPFMGKTVIRKSPRETLQNLPEQAAAQSHVNRSNPVKFQQQLNQRKI